MAGPEIRYTQNAGINIAYQVFGEGPRDLVLVCGTMSHLDLFWTDPLATAMLERLGRFNRVILFDKRPVLSLSWHNGGSGDASPPAGERASRPRS